MRKAGRLALLAATLLAQACSGGASDDASGSQAGAITISHLVDLGGANDPASPIISRSLEVAAGPAHPQKSYAQGGTSTEAASVRSWVFAMRPAESEPVRWADVSNE